MSDHSVISEHETHTIKLGTYLAGFVLSVGLTLTAYYLTVNEALSRSALVAVIIALALVQFIVQMFFFLHLGSESKPRWKSLVFGFMFMVVLILVIGSLWIMDNLNYHMMPEGELRHHMKVEEGL